MYIKSIVLDGFKSYGNRVEINGFDPEFNAITGLNGTGKSNILDSICFVLGITNLSNVRAGSLQELIYKHGQAGIIKATVSITFDNRDKRQCPIGYENYEEITVTRQVVMGGKNKYLINGINVQNKRVSDLFCSVQLNVNNPHFLIMQGRITKVLNMKPPEILSMVEEAAGTRMYEAKKQAAQKTIEKKDAKLRELNDVIREDIAPKLQRLQEERAQFQEYQKVVRELDSLTRLHVAWKYVSAEENAKVAESKVTEVKEEIKNKKETIKNNEKEAKELDKQVTELNKKLDEESGSVLKELETELQSLEREDAKVFAEHKAAKDALAEHEKRSRLLQTTLAHDEIALENKDKDFTNCETQFASLRAGSAAGAAALDRARARFLAASAGREDASDSLQDQLIAAKKEASEASTRITQSKMEQKHVEDRLKTLEDEFKTSSAQYAKDQETINRQQAEADELEEEVRRLEQGAGRLGELQLRARAAAGAARGARAAAGARAARLQRAHFHYALPHPDFDRSRVAGTVCKLIDVRDPIHCTALETAAGGRLYNVIVESAATGKLVVERGRLAARATFIPLDKIQPHTLHPDTVRAAQEIGDGPSNVQLALDLISYPERLRAGMAYVFGGTLVCGSLGAARRVTFAPAVRARSVTLDGDVFDPSGTLSGGAAHQGASVLLELRELKELEQQQQQAEAELAECSAELEQAQRQADKYAKARQRYETVMSALEVARTRQAGSAPAQLHHEVVALREARARLAAAVAADELLYERVSDKVTQLQLKLRDIKGHREREFKKAEEELKKAKIEAEKLDSSWKSREQELETLRLEAAELRAAVEAARAAAAALAQAAASLRAAREDAAHALAASQNSVKQMQIRIKKQKAEIASRNAEIQKLLHKKEQLSKENSESELKIEELDYKIKELQSEATECEKKIKSLEKENPWISEEREYFGLSGGAYDFAARGAAGAAQRVQQLRERRERLSRGLNARAHTLLGKEEDQYQDVMRKKYIVEGDRAKLVEVMAELDEKKKKTLVTACEQVNKDFGSIFSTLLPGAQARLRPPDGLTVLDGLEVKVGFNNTWKESLGELSGGQRSLVALALVLAMLLFKPAPLYILDEVDAALDLAHTQNIGHMLKNHFKHSQFIIVSLKDGMFNNANVLFRTRFVDGMSSVQRTVNEQS